jgi:predicted CopG family antitoxin
MTMTKISLERSAYELLMGRKRPHESVSQELHRILGNPSPDLKGFLEIVSTEDGRAIADAIESIRTPDLDGQRMKASTGRRRHGRHA